MLTLILRMNVTYIYNSYKKPDIIFADFYNEVWAIIILCVLILTRGIVSTIISVLKSEENHVRYSDDFRSVDLKVLKKEDSWFDQYEGFPKGPPNTPKPKPKPNPKIPPRDALV